MKNLGYVMGWRDREKPEEHSWRAAAIGQAPPIKQSIEIREDEAPTLHHIERTRRAFRTIHGFWPHEVHMKNAAWSALQAEVNERCNYEFPPGQLPETFFDMRVVLIKSFS